METSPINLTDAAVVLVIAISGLLALFRGLVHEVLAVISWIGAALATAHNLVAGGGKIVILSELSAELGQGLELVRECDTARDAIQPLRTFLPPDLVPATQLAAAVDWADVYLLSALEGHVVEDLFMVPLDDPDDVSRLLGGDEPCLFLGSAQHTFGQTPIG